VKLLLGLMLRKIRSTACVEEMYDYYDYRRKTVKNIRKNMRKKKDRKKRKRKKKKYTEKYKIYIEIW